MEGDEAAYCADQEELHKGRPELPPQTETGLAQLGLWQQENVMDPQKKTKYANGTIGQNPDKIAEAYDAVALEYAKK